MMLKGLHNDA